MNITYAEWKPERSLVPDAVMPCPNPTVDVAVSEFGRVGDIHPGHLAGHEPLAPATPGRHVMRATGWPALQFRWNIAGSEAVVSAHVCIYRRGSNQPIYRHPVPADKLAEGTFPWDGSLNTVDLAAVRALFPYGVLTVEGGTYMAELHIGAVRSNATISISLRRMYFDLVPIVVIGAGAAGLSAAKNWLEDQTDDGVIHVLEARNRTGGRAFTDFFSHDLCEPIDLGCQWLQNANTNPLVTIGDGNVEHDQTTVALMESFDIPGFADALAIVEKAREDRTAPGSFATVLAKGWISLIKKLVDEDDQITIMSSAGVQKDLIEADLAASRKERIIARLSLATEGNAMSLARGMECELEESIEAEKFTCATWQDQVENAQLNNGHLPVAKGNIEVDNAKTENVNYAPKEGYGRRIADIADQLQEDYPDRLKIMLGSEVIQVANLGVGANPPCFILTLKKGTESLQMLAIAVVIAVPTPIIASLAIEFMPALPAPVFSAFENLPLGHYKKIFLKLSGGPLAGRLNKLAEDKIEKDEDEDEDGGGGGNVVRVEKIYDICFYTLSKNIPWKILYQSNKNMVIAFCGGECALDLDFSDDDACANAVKQAMKDALGKEWAEDIDGGFHAAIRTSHWSTDPYSRGAYSYTRPNCAGGRELLYSTCLYQKLVFAGEALWPDPHGTAHGAWYSGIRASKLLRSYLGDWG